MKYLRQMAIILGITWIGEALNYWIPLPVPSGVYGLFLLLLLLCSGRVKLKSVEESGNLLLDIMPIMFIPASVGIVESYTQVQNVLIPITITCVVSTIVVMAVTGKMTEWLIQKKEGRS